MRVSIDTGPLEAGHAVRGIGVYTQQLVDAINNLKDKNVKVEAIDFSSVDLNKYDLVHYTTFHPYFLTVPEDLESKVIITIHDLIQLIYPEVYVPGIKGRINLFKNRQRLKDVDSIIAVSETTKKDIVRFMKLDESMINVIHEAPKKIYKPTDAKIKFEKIKKKYNLPDKFVLYVGDVNYNKNLRTLIKAAKKAKVKLVISGKQADNLQDLIDDIRILSGPRDYLRYLLGKAHPELIHYEELHELLQDESVITLGFVPDEDLKYLYNMCLLYVQPSLYEGFGLPVVEAMSCGAPVLVSKTNALIEVSGDAALVCDPNNVKQMTSEIRKVLKDEGLRNELSNKSIKRAKDFSWTKTARETLQLYKDVLNAK